MKKILIIILSVFFLGMSNVCAYSESVIDNSNEYRIVLAEEKEEEKKEDSGAGVSYIVILMFLAFLAVAIFIVACKAEDKDDW